MSEENLPPDVASMVKQAEQNAQYWLKAGYEEPHRDLAVLNVEQAMNAYKNAMYALLARLGQGWIPGWDFIVTSLEEIERLLEKIQEGLSGGDGEWYFTVEKAKIIIAALRRGHERGTYCWLIESDHSTYYSGSRYGYEAEHYFFGEPFKAIRYATKAKADEKIRREGWKNVKAVEHNFDERPPSGEMVMVKPETLMEMRAALRFYADDNHQVWVTFEPEGRKRVLQRMKDEPGWVETGEDHRGHEEFVETGARAENALKLLTDEENDAIDRAMLSATEASKEAK